MSQKKRALRYLQTHKRGMTPLDMWVKLGIYRVANKYGESCRVAYYTLED